MYLHPSVKNLMENQDEQPAETEAHLHPFVRTLHAHAQAEVIPNILDSSTYQPASNTENHPTICKNKGVYLDDFDPDMVDWDNLDLTGIPTEYSWMENEQGDVGSIIVPGSPPIGVTYQQNENPFGIPDEPGQTCSAHESDLNVAREAAIRGSRQEATQPVQQGGQQFHAQAGNLQVQSPSVLQPAEYPPQQGELQFGRPTVHQPGNHQAQLIHHPVQQPAQYPIQHPTQQPTELLLQQRPPQAQTRTRHLLAQPAIAPATQPTISITSHAEAQQAAATRPVPHDWQPPQIDNTFPRDQAAEDLYLRQLITAFTSTAHCLNKEKGTQFAARWEHISTGHSIYAPQQIETVCRQLLSITINLHTRGPSALNVLDTVKLKNIWKTRKTTFAQRIAEMCGLLRLSKARCETLMGWEGLHMVVGTPGLLGLQTRRNKENNEGRQKDLEIGREAEMKKWRAERGGRRVMV
jgi:hypothetical protein